MDFLAERVAVRRDTAKLPRGALSGAACYGAGGTANDGAKDFVSGYTPAKARAGKRGSLRSPCIRAKFGIAKQGKEGVTATFAALSGHIRAGGLPEGMIRPGDYIDLEGGLEVRAYKWRGQFRDSALDYRELGGRGSQLRLIVAGINSFHAAENGGTPHVVFQFQNIPVVRRMNAAPDNAGGYAASELRRYLVDADGDGTGGAFLEGLLAAGVPETALWAPARYMESPGGKGVLTKDLLWLPAEGELFGRVPKSEKAGQPARLEYYRGGETREKRRNGRRMCYWTASPAKDEGLFSLLDKRMWRWAVSPTKDKRFFSLVDTRGKRMLTAADIELGCVPAFCVG